MNESKLIKRLVSNQVDIEENVKATNSDLKKRAKNRGRLWSMQTILTPSKQDKVIEYAEHEFDKRELKNIIRQRLSDISVRIADDRDYKLDKVREKIMDTSKARDYVLDKDYDDLTNKYELEKEEEV